MQSAEDAVERHYGRGGVLAAILEAVCAEGQDPDRLAPADLAAEHGCAVIGLDRTREWVDAADALTKLVGLDHLVTFRHGSALDMPFDDGSFDVVWSDHVQMNVPDKRGFYAEIARVLKPRGRLLCHDILQGPGGLARYPAFWAEDEAISFLATPEVVRAILDDLGLAVLEWDDRTEASLDSAVAALEQAQRSGLSPLGPHLLTGDTGDAKLTNSIHDLRERHVVVRQAVAENRSRSTR